MPRLVGMGEASVKRAVRERDGQQCVECGMTAEQHIARFGHTLPVHRIKPGSEYQVDGCITLCQWCHYAKHDLGWAIRKRDGYVCVECRTTDGLVVHCVRSDNCPHECCKVMRLEECVTLCWSCHLRKHNLRPSILKRDDFRCTVCGKPADRPNNVHRLTGTCAEAIGPLADPADFTTLCDQCHQAAHPDWSDRYVVCAFEYHVENQNEQYQKAARMFLRYFFDYGVPDDDWEPSAIGDLPLALCRQAAKEIIAGFDQRGFRRPAKT